MPSQQMESIRNAMRMMMKQQGMPMFGAEFDPFVLRATIEAAEKRMVMEPGVTFIPENLGGVPAEICMPENARTDGVIVYIHGGGLICGNALSSRGYGSMLAGETKLPVYTLSYRLAPEHPFPAGVDDCFAAYQELLTRFPDLPIVLIGESGGAHLCITTTFMAKAAGVRLPAAIIPYSPVLDLSGTIDRSVNLGKDFTLTEEGLGAICKFYCPDEDLTNPLLSPMFGDYTDFPPMLLAWDASETLAPDSELLVQKARAVGAEVQAKGYDDCFHAFATAGRGTPESAEILADTVAFINQHLK